MNILFVNYGNIRSNSMGHIGPYANELAKRGHSCAVALENYHPATKERSGLYEIYSHSEIAAGRSTFPNRKAADIIHAWTPRENVRELTVNYLKRHPQTRLVVHLEDNEEALLEANYLKSFAELRQLALEHEDYPWHPRLSHPVEYRRLLASADAVTLITPSLAKLLPFFKSTTLIRPILEQPRSATETDRNDLLRSLGLPIDKQLIVFPGGITSNNRRDVMNLYVAVHLLRQKGLPLKIVKTGPSCELFERSFQFNKEEVAIDLGYLDETILRDLLKQSALFVQPGQDNEFNRDRFPCKIPEYLASGRPCIIPEFYIPEHIPDDHLCLALKESTPREIAEKIEILIAHPEKGEQLARNAKAFAKEAFNAGRNGNKLERLYQQVLSQKLPSPTLAELPEEIANRRSQLERECQDLLDKNRIASTECRRAQNDLATKVSKLEAMERELEEWKQRDQRRRSTFSWQCTAPLRFLRRLLIDPLTKEAVTAPSPPIGQSESAPPSEEISVESQDEGIPSDHRCFIKRYHKFVEREEWIRSIYLDKYQHPQAGPSCPKISVLLPVYNVDEKWLRKCIDSVLNQAYQNWELCIADDASTVPHVAPVLAEYEKLDPRIRLAFRSNNGHISAASNSAFELASGDYIALLDHDDELPPHALAKVVDAIGENPAAKLIYSDEDKIDENGIRHDPHFKSDWNYDLLLGCNMISHLGIYRRDAYEEAGGFRIGYEGAQDWDLALRTIELCKPNEIVHIPEILYHWRTIETSTALHHSKKDYAHEAQQRAISDHLIRQGKNAELISIDGIHWRVRYRLPKDAPKVSIIIPTKDWPDLISKCVESVLEKTSYPNYELLIVDNQSTEPLAIDFLSRIQADPRVKVLAYDSGFNYSAINNYAVSQSDADIVCLLNNDTEVISTDWLEELVSHAIRPEVGIVGAKLLYPDDHIQHAGIVLGIDGVAKHAFRFLHKNDFGHVHRANLISQWSAVTGACMAVRRSVWERLGGLNEQDLAVAYNDVDLCLRVRSEGLSVLLSPYALLYHKESATRGFDQSPEQLALHHTEAAYMYRNWPKVLKRDPLYNPNFSKTKNDFEYIT
ncbi:glycosyltransferase [Pelagicoccus enzymogenes]|uniref:glycosyltransferase n=1 Tax=Pelagicoccus enzymogenes TaxID=2773457 RepID=UPI00281086CA|nr:glycosyltransferase [Pelagicoccus enzymogenes]MDQ8197554.1 glycosyltransferase [Pelagicoccus enzymogenes]